MNETDIFNFLNQFRTDDRKRITDSYIQGRITKEEFIKRMNSIKERKGDNNDNNI